MIRIEFFRNSLKYKQLKQSTRDAFSSFHSAESLQLINSMPQVTKWNYENDIRKLAVSVDEK